MTNKQTTPSLEQRIATMLNNANAGATELSEIVAETERAISAAEHDIATAKEEAVDVVAAPDAKAAFDAVQFAEHGRDRLQRALPKLRQRLTAALATERHDRWAAEYRKVEAVIASLQQDMDDFHTRFADEADALEDRIAKYNQEVRRVNAFAFEIDEHSRLPRLSLWAATSDERRWGPPRVVNNGLAVALAASMPPTPHPAGRWWDPSHPVVAAQRDHAEHEREDIARYHEQAAREQETRQNIEERRRFEQQQRRGWPAED